MKKQKVLNIYRLYFEVFVDKIRVNCRS